MYRIYAHMILSIVVVATVSCDRIDSTRSSGLSGDGVLPRPLPTDSPVSVGQYIAGDGKYEIGEPVTLHTDGPIGAYRYQESSEDGLVARFQVSELPLVAAGTYDDIVIGYGSGNSGPQDVAIWNVRHQRWDVVSSSISGFGFLTVMTHFDISVHGAGLKVSDYISASGITEVRSESSVSMSVSRFNPDYLPIQLSSERDDGDQILWYLGLEFDGTALWASAINGQGIFQMSSSGDILKEISLPGTTPYQMAYGDSLLWLRDGNSRIFGLDLDGSVSGSFSIPFEHPLGLGYHGGALWLSEYADSTYLFKIEPLESLASGVAVITDTIHIPGTGRLLALESDGDQLLMISSMGYSAEAEVVRLAPDGTVIERMQHAPYFSDVTLADGRLWGLVGQFAVGYDLP